MGRGEELLLWFWDSSPKTRARKRISPFFLLYYCQPHFFFCLIHKGFTKRVRTGVG